MFAGKMPVALSIESCFAAALVALLGGVRFLFAGSKVFEPYFANEGLAKLSNLNSWFLFRWPSMRTPMREERVFSGVAPTPSDTGEA